MKIKYDGIYNVEKSIIPTCSICRRDIDWDHEVYYALVLQEMMPNSDGSMSVLTDEPIAHLCKKCVIIKNMFNATIPEK